MNKLNFIMLAGLPATGKSTFRKDYENNSDWVIISSDDFVEEEAKKLGVTYNEVFKNISFRELNNKIIGLVKFAIANNKNIIWDQTNLSIKVRNNRVKSIPNNYFKKLVWFKRPDDNIWNHRLNNRPGKNIPKDVLDTMISNCQEPTNGEGFDSFVVVEN